jgi:hypothetical protein
VGCAAAAAEGEVATEAEAEAGTNLTHHAAACMSIAWEMLVLLGDMQAHGIQAHGM